MIKSLLGGQMHGCFEQPFEALLKMAVLPIVPQRRLIAFVQGGMG